MTLGCVACEPRARDVNESEYVCVARGRPTPGRELRSLVPAEVVIHTYDLQATTVNAA